MMSTDNRNIFSGYRRTKGAPGVRNSVIVLPTIGCANEMAHRIAKAVPLSIPMLHNHACIRAGKDALRARLTLEGIGANPNVHSALIVGIGCEPVKAADLAATIREQGKDVRYVSLDECGTYERLIEKGISLLEELVSGSAVQRREFFPVSELTIGIKCGGSGTVSAIASNPTVGRAADIIISHGGKAVFTETAELIGAEHVLAKRAADSAVKERLLRMVQDMKDEIERYGVDILGSEPTQGNIKSGLTTLEEKSLGAIIKSGTCPLSGVLEYGHKPKNSGMYFMDGTTQASQLMLGMTAAGAQIHLFSFGGGLPARFRGLPSYPPGIRILPVIKILGSCDDEDEKDHFDLYAGNILKGTESIADAGSRLYDLILDVASGKPTYTESRTDYDEMLQIYANGLLM
jgi:altronate dehydratase large subunit